MIPRPGYLQLLDQAVRRAPVTALLGPRQCGKTTLARLFVQDKRHTFFDLESQPDLRRLENPEMVLGGLDGLVVLDEIQVKSELFAVLRVLVDRPENGARFLILWSASPAISRKVSESLAGRVEFIELAGFNLTESSPGAWQSLWLRGGFPRAFMAESDDDSLAWREGFIRTFLERDLPQLGIAIPAPAMRRFWTMLAHYHGQTWKASDLGRAMGLSEKTVRSYLDILSGAFMVRHLQPWYENIRKRQVKAPKIYLRDSGLLHAMFNLSDLHSLLGHPRVGASWEGFALEQVLQIIKPPQAYFWATHAGAELDLFLLHLGRRWGMEFKFLEAPRITKSAHIAVQDLQLEHLWVIYPGRHDYPVHDRITVWPLNQVADLYQVASKNQPHDSL